MAIRTSLDKIPYDHQRVIFSCLTGEELNNTAQTCKRVLKNVSNDEVGLRKRVAAINARIQEKNDDIKKNDPLLLGFFIPAITLRPNEPIMRQLQDRGFEIELANRLGNASSRARVHERSDRVYRLTVGIFCSLMIGAAVTSSAPVSLKALAVMGNIPALVSKPPARWGYYSSNKELLREMGRLTLGTLQVGGGYVFLAYSVFSENLHGYRFSLALIGTGAVTALSTVKGTLIADSSLIHSMTRALDEKCTRAYIICTARAERAMRRSSCCLKVSSTIGAIKRYAAATLFELIRPIARIATPPI